MHFTLLIITLLAISVHCNPLQIQYGKANLKDIPVLVRILGESKNGNLPPYFRDNFDASLRNMASCVDKYFVAVNLKDTPIAYIESEILEEPEVRDIIQLSEDSRFRLRRFQISRTRSWQSNDAEILGAKQRIRCVCSSGIPREYQGHTILCQIRVPTPSAAISRMARAILSTHQRYEGPGVNSMNIILSYLFLFYDSKILYKSTGLQFTECSRCMCSSYGWCHTVAWSFILKP